MKSDNAVVVITILLSLLNLPLPVTCRSNDANDIRGQRYRNPSRTKNSHSSAKVIEISVRNATHSSNITELLNNNSNKIDIKDYKLAKRKKDILVCPNEAQAPFQLLPTLCRRNRDCKKSSKRMKCCDLFGSRRCIAGVPKLIPEPKHDPIFGIPRKCPQQPLTETFWDIQTCGNDSDCWPRICCPDGGVKYCRTSQPLFEKSDNPTARQLAYPIEAVSQYIQCTPAPPVLFDIHPKECNTTLDCFPNLCCQEAGKRRCRPPKRSLLTLVTGFTSRINIGILKDITGNLVIRK